MVGV
ncbi:Protein of unknown function [Bacillus mycoides]|jgi:hypothetical protein